MKSDLLIPHWLQQRTFAVLVLDGTDRLTSFPRLTVFPVEGGRWGGCVAVSAGQHRRLATTAPTADDAKCVCLRAARAALPPRWYNAVDAALAALPADTQRPSRAVAAPATAASRRWA